MSEATNQSSTRSISYQIETDGFRIFVFGKEYVVRYPIAVYGDVSETVQRALAENFIYCRVKSLSLPIDDVFEYNFAKPVDKDFVAYGIQGDIPRLAYLSKMPIEELRSIFERNRGQEVFTTNAPFILPALETNNRAILALSFGKDSLLTYGVAKELGLDMKLVYVREMESLNEPEERFKAEIIDKFIKNEHVSIELLTDNIDEIFIDVDGDRVIDDVDNTNGMLAFTMELLPFAYHHRARYMLFGNEANFSDFFLVGEDAVYPSFDQSILYAKKKNELLDTLTSGSIQVASLVEPIYNIVEMAVLVQRYPQLLPYLMSCSPQEGDQDRWCYRCPMCAKAFLYLVAVGGNPKDIGFNQDFFSAQYKKLYPLFNENVERVYEKPAAVRDEQLLSFLFAYRRGLTGELIDEFVASYLSEAITRERELKAKFLSLHEMPTVPDFIKPRLMSIYQEAIDTIS